MRHDRHMELFNCNGISVTLIGAGGIGAATALVLAKMGISYLTIVDGDTVDEINLATQFHRLSDVRRPKAEAVKDMLLEFSDDTDIATINERMEADGYIWGRFAISAVDSINARKDIWNAVKRGKVRWYMDARMAAEEAHIHCIDMQGDVSWYENVLAPQTDENVSQEPCTAKATIYTASVIAGLIGKTLKQALIGEVPPRILTLNMRTDCLTVIQ